MEKENCKIKDTGLGLSDAITAHHIVARCIEDVLGDKLKLTPIEAIKCNIRLGADKSDIVVHEMDDDDITVIMTIMHLGIRTLDNGTTLIVESIAIAKPFRKLRVFNELSQMFRFYFDTVIFLLVSNNTAKNVLSRNNYIKSPLKDNGTWKVSSWMEIESCKKNYKYYEKGFKIIDMINVDSPYLQDYNNIQNDCVNEDEVNTTTERAEEVVMASVGLKGFLLRLFKRRK